MNTINKGLAIIFALLIIGLAAGPVQAEIEGAELLPPDKVQTFILKSGTIIKGVPIPEKETEYEYRVEVAPGRDIPVKKWELLDLDKVREGIPVYKEEYEIKALEKKLELIEKSLDDLETSLDENGESSYIKDKDRFFSRNSVPYVPQNRSSSRYSDNSYRNNRRDGNVSLDSMINDYLNTGRYFNGRTRQKNSYDYQSDAYRNYGYDSTRNDYHYSYSESSEEEYSDDSSVNYFRSSSSNRRSSAYTNRSSNSDSPNSSSSGNSLEELVKKRLEKRNRERSSNYFQQNSIRN
jgi:hypothetical protein